MKKLFLILFLAAMPGISFSQYWEIGILLGASNYMGDLSPSPVTISETKPAAGAIVRYNHTPFLTIKGNVYAGTLSGSDQNAPISDHFRRTRNLSFRSRVLEFGIQPEINITGFESGNRRYQISPYVFAGISVFRFNPKAFYDDEWVPLQPLGTEGQETTQYQDRKKYSLTQFSIPYGIGLKSSISDVMNLGFEFGLRKTFTDYIDDVSMTYVEEDILVGAHGPRALALSNRSGEVGNRVTFGPEDQRGNPSRKDGYLFTGITITYSILPNPCPRFY